MAIKIMIDPGHAGDYFNQSPVVPKYYESTMTWDLSKYLKTALENRGFIVDLTRVSKYDNPELTERGRRAAGYDLFLSIHSNAAASETPDAPWIIHFSNDNKTTLDEKSKAIAQVLGPVISDTMGVGEPYYYNKNCGEYDRDGNGYYDDEYYGVLFGAKSVDVPGIILEHSFHTNKKVAEWLLNKDNLERLAEAEADALATYYGLEDAMTTAEKKEFEALKTRVKELESQVKPKWAYIDNNLPKWARPTIQKLAEKGHLKGNDKNSFELSYLMMRILVILDRAKIFD